MNEKPPCPKCQSIEVVKNGKVQGKQKDKCNSCSLQFTRLTPRGRPAQEKAMAVTLYTLGLSIRAIAGLIGVSPTAVLKWIKTFAKTHYEDFRFDPMDSCLLRVGTRLSYEIFQGFSPYAGVAWEHEFDGPHGTEQSRRGCTLGLHARRQRRLHGRLAVGSRSQLPPCGPGARRFRGCPAEHRRPGPPGLGILMAGASPAPSCGHT